ncbi:hypothetical protein MC885_005371 [Smutsia gigantea]|nr:hypothetical protein MC885_005371 [Smutsia gigantea]
MKPLPPLHPAGGISTEKPALGLFCPKGGNFMSPGLPGSGREARRETENNYYALENKMVKRKEMSQHPKYLLLLWHKQDEETSCGDLALWLLYENTSWWCLDLQHHFCHMAIRRLKELKDQ